MRILYVSQYFPPEMGAPAARVYELARRWSRAGHKVTVLTGFPNHPTGVVVPEFRAKFRRLVCRDRIDGIDVVRTWLAPFPNRKPLERILNYTSFFVSSCLTGMFLRSHDIVIGTSPQLLVALTAYWLSAIKRIPFVMEVRDLWPESLTASGVGNEKSIMISALRALSGFLYRRSERVVAVSPAFREVLTEKWAIPTEKISVVTNGVEIDVFTPDNSSEKAKQLWNLRETFVVSFVGTIGLAQGLDTLLEAAARLQNITGITFVLVGEGAAKERLMEAFRERGLKNFRFFPQQPREKIPSIICASDICLVLLKNAGVFKTVIPTKMLEFMACGRAVILGVDGQAREILEKARAGIFVLPEDSGELTAAIERLYRDSSLRKTLGINGRQYVVDNFSRACSARYYLSVLHRVLARSKKSVKEYRFKRPFDWVVAGVGLLLSSPLWVLIAFLIKLDDRGPVFYGQQRVGKDGSLFRSQKFRSMVPDSDKRFGPLQAKDGDQRVTRVGRYLRATAMDELPQLWNILCGHMSFVGPRALLPEEIEVAGDGDLIALKAIPGYEARHRVRPGLTGLSQIYASRDMPRRQKFRIDLLYIRKQNFWLDLKLIVLSFWISFWGKWETRSRKI